MNNDTLRTMNSPILSIIVLAMGGLFIGTGEFVSMSLLPSLATTIHISIRKAGDFISAYAIGVVVGAPVIAITTARWARRFVLVGLIVIFSVGYFFSAIAWSYHSLLIARFISGIPHGAYYGIACLVAASLMGENRKAQASGYVMVGLAVANVVGVPAATWLGQIFGWRITFTLLSLMGVLCMVLFMCFIPAKLRDENASPQSELMGLRNSQIWMVLVSASIGFGGMFAIYSYITPTLTEVTGVHLIHVPIVLMVWGIGMVVGNIIGGKMSDKAMVPTIFFIMVWNTLLFMCFSIFATSKLLTILLLFLIGCGFALVPALQVYLMTIAGKAQTLAATLNHSAFNIANALGAYLGGLSINAGFGFESTGYVACILAILGVIFFIITVLIKK